MCQFEFEEVNDCNFIDLGASGPAFTWSNMREGWARVRERLDKAYVNPQWRQAFPEAWDNQAGDLHQIIDHFTTTVKNWNRDCFGNIFLVSQEKKRSLFIRSKSPRPFPAPLSRGWYSNSPIVE